MSGTFDYILAKHEDSGGMPLTTHLKSVADAAVVMIDAMKDRERFLKENNVRYDHIIFNAGEGERIMINDMKPDGLVTAYSPGTTKIYIYAFDYISIPIFIWFKFCVGTHN